jgi:hypothetical protein
MIQNTRILGMWRVVVWGGAALLLCLPAIAMAFFPAAGVNWSGSDFVVMGVMLFIACAAVEVGAHVADDFPYLGGVVCAVGAGFVTVWANLAVGMIGDTGNPANLVFLGVLALAVLGTLASRFQARGMAKVMLTVGVLQALVGACVAVAGVDYPQTGALIAAFALPWWLSAYLFHLSANHGARFARG